MKKLIADFASGLAASLAMFYLLGMPVRLGLGAGIACSALVTALERLVPALRTRRLRLPFALYLAVMLAIFYLLGVPLSWGLGVAIAGTVLLAVLVPAVRRWRGLAPPRWGNP